MKQILLLITFCMFNVTAAFSQEEALEVPPLRELYEWMEVIEKEGKYGLADFKGKVVVAPAYSSIEYKSFAPYVRVEQNKRYGIIDLSNKVIIPIIYNKIEKVTGNSEAFLVSDSTTKSWDIATDLRNTQNESLLPSGAEIRGYEGGEIKIRINNLEAVIDVFGRYLLEPTYDYVSIGGPLFKVCMQGKCGFVDKKTQKVIIPLIYKASTYFRNGLYILSINEKYGVLNTRGETILPFKYRKILTDHNKVFCVPNDDGKYALYNVLGQQISPWFDYIKIGNYMPFYNYQLDDKYGYIDLSGNIITEAIFDEAVDIHSWDKCKEVLQNGQKNYLTKEGKVLDQKCE